MPFAQSNLPGVFGPSELSALSTAFDVAMERVSDDNGLSHVKPRDIRRRLAAGIISAAQAGIVDVEDLATEGLRVLSADPDRPGAARYPATPA